MRPRFASDHQQIRQPKLSLLVPILCFPLFTLIVYLIQGSTPPLSPDHISYIEQGNSISHQYTGLSVFRAWTSNQGLGVLLAFLQPLTASYIIALKIILATNTMMFLWAFLLFSTLFCQDVIVGTGISCVAAMSVSFGVTSWGLTDSAALLGRSLAFPWITICLWLYFRFYDSWKRLFVFPLLVLVSLLHLGSYHVFGALMILELFNWIFIKQCRLSSNEAFLAASLLSSFGVLVILERSEVSPNLTSFISSEIRPPGKDDRVGHETRDKGLTRIQRKSLLHDYLPLPTNGGAINPLVLVQTKSLTGESSTPLQRYTPEVAWAAELSLRGWRNMPLPLINVANIISSVFLILILGVLGYINSRNRSFTRLDKPMALFAAGVVTFAFLPQTLLWGLRSHWPIYPVNFEEIRTLSWIMIPCIYFSYSLYALGSQCGIKFGVTKRNRSLLLLIFLALPLTLKALSPAVRESLLECAIATGAVSANNPGALQNAREALGIAHQHRYYYDVLPTVEWIRHNVDHSSLILTDRDELLLSNISIIGSRQQAVLANPQDDPLQVRQIFFETKEAMDSGKLGKVFAVARHYGADYALVPWSVATAAYHDEFFSVVKVPKE